MAAKKLTLAQQLALQPATVPEAVLDLLLDFSEPTPLQSENTKEALADDLLEHGLSALKSDLQQIRENLRTVHDVAIKVADRPLVSTYFCRLSNGIASAGIAIKTESDKVSLVIVQTGGYDEAGLKEAITAE